MLFNKFVGHVVTMRNLCFIIHVYSSSVFVFLPTNGTNGTNFLPTIKTIHSSLAIEGNTLSEDEVRDILEFGVSEKKVLLFLASNPSLTAGDIANQTGLSKRGIEKQLKKFRDLIARTGSDKNGLWVINKGKEE